MSERAVELTSEMRDILLDPCACGHTLNDHGNLGGCWICNETNDRECWVRCEDMFAKRAARIVAARLADAEARAEAAVCEFVQWVATSRAYNGSDHHVYAQSLYNDQINDALPKWAEEWFREALRGDQ